jgi:hypothetical protein
MTTTNSRFFRAVGAAAAEVDGDTVLIAPTDRRCFGLNSTGTHVWGLLPAAGATGVTTEELVDALVEVYDVEQSTCHTEVTRLLTAMTDAGVVTSTP